MMDKKPLVLFLIGPTASGKSTAAVELARALNAEIISADSMQVYRGLDILSAKPGRPQRVAITHHLVDILDPAEEYSVAMFREQALVCIKDIHGRNKLPMVVGGTGLYVQALIRGLFEDKGKDPALRERLQQEADEKGAEYLYEKLRGNDPAAAKIIHPRNVRRVIRALEACAMNQELFSESRNKTEPLEQHYEVRVFGIQRNREDLYRRIEQRVEHMFSEGAVEEVRALLRKSLSRTAQQALGIKQISTYLEGNCSLAQAKDVLKRDTRHFAKRQLTWFCREKNITWIDAEDNSMFQEIVGRILSILFLSS